MGKFKISLVIISTIVIFINLVYPVYQNINKFTEKFNPKTYEKKYNQSQWVIPQSKNIISDEDLYSYEGYRYIHGENPIYLNPEVPPLGKYLLGLSIVVFGNQRIISLLAAIISLILIFYLIYYETHSFISSSAVVLLTSVNSLFLDQLTHSPQLDIFQLLFLLLFLIFYLFYLKKKKILLLFISGFFFGCFISIKFTFVFALLINLSLFVFYFLKKTTIKKIITELVSVNLFGFLIYLLTYSRFFLTGGSVHRFLGAQKWILLFYQSSQIDITKLLGDYLGLIFFNSWRFWTVGYPVVHYQYWSLLWPLISILGIYSIYKYIKKYKIADSNLMLFCLSFLIIYNIFLFFTPIFPRYLLLLFVFLNIPIAVYFGKVIEKIK